MPADIKGKKVESIMLEHENKTYPNATYSFLTQLNNLIIKCFLFITSVHTMNIAYFFITTIYKNVLFNFRVMFLAI